MNVTFTALVKEVQGKALVSGDKSFRVLLETSDPRVAALISAPADGDVTVTVDVEGVE